MKTDGSVIIDTKIIDGGMEKGFKVIKGEMESVGIAAEEMGEKLKLSFSKADVSKQIAATADKIKNIEQKIAQSSSALDALKNRGFTETNSQEVSRIVAERERLYEHLAAAQNKLASEINASVNRQAKEEEKAAERAAEAARKAAERKIKEEEKITKAKQKEAVKQRKALLKPAEQFSSRLRSIISGALIFNLISSGLRSVTKYFGDALKSNDQFSKALARLKGALLTAFQPIYDYVLPALITLVNVLAAVVSRIANFFSLISGKTISDTSKAAEKLYGEANAINAVGSAAKKAGKSLAGFDEVNKLQNSQQDSSGGGSGETISPSFDFADINSELGITEETLDRILGIVLAVGSAFLTWKVLSTLGVGGWVAAAAAAIIGLVVLIATCGDEIQKGLEDLDTWFQGVFAKDWTETFGLLGGVVLNGLMSPLKRMWNNVRETCDGLIDFIRGVFTGDWERALEGIVKLVDGAAGLATSFLLAPFDLLASTLFSFAQKVLPDGWKQALNGVISVVNRFIAWLNNALSFSILPIEIAGKTIFSGGYIRLANIQQIPYLAQGAVIPPNAPFMAMLGDQKHGTNIEAPLSTIQEAVALVMEDYAAANLAGHEATVAVLRDILEAVLGIEIGDDVIGSAAQRWNVKRAIMRGGT